MFNDPYQRQISNATSGLIKLNLEHFGCIICYLQEEILINLPGIRTVVKKEYDEFVYIACTKRPVNVDNPYMPFSLIDSQHR